MISCLCNGENARRRNIYRCNIVGLRAGPRDWASRRCKPRQDNFVETNLSLHFSRGEVSYPLISYFQVPLPERIMARVTVEDCIDKVENRFDLVLLASHRARVVSSGAPITIERDNDKNPVVALREI